MRIVAGRHRGARLRAPAGRDIRPTADRTREALFNLLANGRHGRPLAGQVVIDACAGTGALGLEALSRGADQALFLENDRQALEIIRANIAHLGVADACQVLAVDVTRPGPPPRPGNILLLDPPYASDLDGPAISALAGAGWLAKDARVVVETAAKAVFAPPTDFTVLDERRYGAAKLIFLSRA